MGRFHALEWEDLAWFPRAWRDYGTDYLQFIATKFDIYKKVAPVVEKGIKASGQSAWLDCASGGGGGLLRLSAHLKPKIADLQITLTDFYPNEKAFQRTQSLGGAHFSYTTSAVDARKVPEQYKGKFRTLFGAFHHFRPNDAQQILQNAVDTSSPIAIFEPVGRNFGSFFSMLFVILNVLILTPFIRPVRWSVLPFIYLIPLIPLYVMWDGIASCFRVYSVKEMQHMVSKLSNAQDFNWEIGQLKNGPMPTTYLLGYPKKQDGQ